MKKWLVYFIAIWAVMIQTAPCSFAKIDTLTQVAIRKYRHGNYTGCMQDCEYIVSVKPSNALAYYYLGMSCVQAGRKDEAIYAYSKVLSFHKIPPQLRENAQTGKRCIQTPTKCHFVTHAATVELSQLDKFIANPSSDGLSDSVRKDFKQKQLDYIKDQINADKTLDDYSFRKLNKADTTYKIAINNSDSNYSQTAPVPKQPTNEEIGAALKTLNAAGINPYMQNANNVNYQNQDMSALNMLMGSNNQSQNNDGMLNMLPYMMMQNPNGAPNGYSPQMMHAVILNSMMPDFNLNVDKDK